jgi:WhiB family redox-sensing transcriptional regulator
VAVGIIHDWRSRAACRGPATELFFAPTVAERKEDRKQREAKAKAICGQCPVRGDCLDYALGLREAHGIWGGLTEGERRLLTDATPN